MHSAAQAQISGEHQLALENGIWVEQFDSTNTDKNPYTGNNKVFREGTRFTYRYVYISPDGSRYLQKIASKVHPDREKAWILVPLNEKDSLTNDQLQLIVESDFEGVDAKTPGYNHTPFRYEYQAPAGRLHFLERSSLIENRKNIWMHPPRARLFRILALNPFPYIQAPYRTGHTWEWQQEIPSHFSDARWAIWEEPVLNRYRYALTREETLPTALGTLPCMVVEGEAFSTLGTTHLTAHYHLKYGFVKMLYTNIDGSQLLLELIRVAE